MFQTGLTGLVGSLGSVSKIVLLLLFVFSVISWAVIFSKWRMFRVADREDKRFLALLVKARDLDELYRQAGRIEGSPSAYVFEGVMERVGSGQSREGVVAARDQLIDTWWSGRRPISHKANSHALRAGSRSLPRREILLRLSDCSGP